MRIAIVGNSGSGKSTLARAIAHQCGSPVLDLDSIACLANCRQRPWEAHKFQSKAEQDEKLPFLLTWVREYYVRDGSMSLREHDALFRAYTGPKRRLREALDSRVLAELID